MNLSDFLKSEGIILLDGAMGTELEKFGLEMGGSNCVTNPEAVLKIHKKYLESGCGILTTNTLTMNRVFIDSHNLIVDVREVNMAGARLARSIAKTDCFVLGDLSSTGKFLKPYGNRSEADFYEAFSEQAGILSEGGVDGFIIETMFDLKEALCALRACKRCSTKPVFVSMAFTTTKNGGRTMMGDSAEDCALLLTEAGADAVGVNCGDLDPFQAASVVSVFKKRTHLPLLAQPNAGKPELENGRTVFKLDPESYAEGVSECIKAGARLVGGCCGTTPGHIAAVAEAINKRS
jgi:5-methyltetrahydrofolate--homocysteine methyltransferase